MENCELLYNYIIYSDKIQALLVLSNVKRSHIFTPTLSYISMSGHTRRANEMGDTMFFTQVLDFLSGIVFLLLHVTGSGTFPKALSKAEEQQCLAEMAQGSSTARRRLIEHNLRLVAHIVKKYYANQNDQEDLISIGTIGLIKAVDTFDAEKGIKLSSYASRCIEKTILS